MSYSKTIIVEEVRRALQKPGCPICNLLARIEDSMLFQILYEHVLDSIILEKLAKGLPFCRRHMMLIVAKSLSDPNLGLLPASIVLERILELDSIEASECLLCSQLSSYEQIYVETLSEILASNLEAYASTPAILCYKHLLMIANQIGKCKLLLLKTHRRKLEKYLNSVRTIIESYKYDSEVQRPKNARKILMEIVKIVAGEVSFSTIKPKNNLMSLLKKLWRP